MKMIVFLILLSANFLTHVMGQDKDYVTVNSAENNGVPLSIREILSKKIEWHRIDSIPINFRTYHTQGLTKVGEYFFLTAVEVKRWPRKYETPMGNFDRDQGEGIGHVFKFNEKGDLIDHITIGESDVYHPGGLDFDGERLWIPVCEYRPFGRSILYSIDPDKMSVQTTITIDDAIGALAFDREHNRLIGVNWGSTDYYTWQLDEKRKEVSGPVKKQRNLHFNLAIQDMQYVSHGYILCSGLFTYSNHPEIKQFISGGLSIIRTADLLSLSAIPVDQYTYQGQVLTGNPFHVELSAQKILCYFMPEDDNSNLYIYELQ